MMLVFAITIQMNTLPTVDACISFSAYTKCFPNALIAGLILPFKWDKKPPRIQNQSLQRPKLNRGLALRDFRFYYWAAYLRIVQYFLQSRQISSLLVWLTEAASSIPASLCSLTHTSISGPCLSLGVTLAFRQPLWPPQWPQIWLFPPS